MAQGPSGIHKNSHFQSAHSPEDKQVGPVECLKVGLGSVTKTKIQTTEDGLTMGYRK